MFFEMIDPVLMLLVHEPHLTMVARDIMKMPSLVMFKNRNMRVSN